MRIGRSLLALAAGTAGIAIAFGAAVPAVAQENETCLECHSDRDLTGERGGMEISVFVDGAMFGRSVHGDLQCIACHADLEGSEFPHKERVRPVYCGTCHEDVAEELMRGPHGSWSVPSEHPSASCISCHGQHDVLPPSDPAAPTSGKKSLELCGQCHENEVGEVAGSVHAGKVGHRPNATCSDCHRGHDMTQPKTEALELQVCGRCHKQQAAEQARSVHARAALHGDPLAPSCISCHGHHRILSSESEASPISKVNVPVLCGRCHAEGTRVSKERDIPQSRILENYSMSIHGEGLFKMGLTVTAVCTSCHNSHLILAHADPKSSINPDNVAATCTRCHARIEKVHTKVIEGRLWEEEPNKIPACIDCHQPHKIRRSPLNPKRVANKECMRCHANPELAVERDGKNVSLFVDEEAFDLSSHGTVACAQCHTDVSTRLKRPCAAVTKKVDCSICHAEVVGMYKGSVHGQLAAKGDPEAPTCLSCHSAHATQDHLLPSSPSYSRNVPKLCGRCHAQGMDVAKRVREDIKGRLTRFEAACMDCHKSAGARTKVIADVSDIVGSFTRSAHGKGLLESGLVVAASCVDCHTSHDIRKPDDPRSSINPKNVADTCGTCHKGIEERLKKSVHWPGNAKTDRRVPTCEDCHTSHSICRTNVRGFRTMMVRQCGRCHEAESATFFDTLHGKVSRLGDEAAAKCYDCHGTHNILPPDDPGSTLSHTNVVKTCAKCHPGAHRQFAGYLTHATHHDPKKYPYLYYAYLFMTTLLVGTLAVFILHTLLWLFRLWRTREEWRPHKRAKHDRFYVRFTLTQRINHLVMILSFFTLAITGMTLKFSYMGWAKLTSHLLGGYETTGVLHRIAALVLVGLFVYHLRQVFKIKKRSGKSWWSFLTDKDSMVPGWNDIRQLWQSMKWFVGRGERPHYGRFTYWEKFDYFAVFWGVFVIGGTGLMLWFPTVFTHLLPGWMINVATIIHSDEALLATAFIFTIHFFNTHFRPDKFPMDPVIFTGRVPVDELEHDKPGEYEELMAMDHPEERMAGGIPRRNLMWIKVFGYTALTVGLTLIGLILYAMLFGYR